MHFYHRYGIWYRAEISATGTSANTPAINPINIPVLQSSENVAHSNGMSGFVGLCVSVSSLVSVCILDMRKCVGEGSESFFETSS